MTKPRAWRNPEKIKRCRPRPVTDAPFEIPDSKVGQLDAVLHQSGVLELIDAELAGRPGPKGLPVRTVLVGLLLALHHHRSASLADVCRVLLDELRAPPAPGSASRTTAGLTATPGSRSPAASTGPSTA
ncbi:hypothetical protein [Streptomyces sp. NPDC088910]|uniref:hypothetical protein n=1 Tax=Streptomyces sp. NPDC088910 TaxID=3365911 RepID=UPI00381C678E